jgi:hypothetical protein
MNKKRILRKRRTYTRFKLNCFFIWKRNKLKRDKKKIEHKKKKDSFWKREEVIFGTHRRARGPRENQKDTHTQKKNKKKTERIKRRSEFFTSSRDPSSVVRFWRRKSSVVRFWRPSSVVRFWCPSSVMRFWKRPPVMRFWKRPSKMETVCENVRQKSFSFLTSGRNANTRRTTGADP